MEKSIEGFKGGKFEENFQKEWEKTYRNLERTGKVAAVAIIITRAVQQGLYVLKKKSSIK